MSSAYDIQGRNCIFQMKIGDVYMDVICAKTFSLNRVYELKETTTKLSGFDKEFRPRKKSYTISFNGVVQVVAAGDKPTIKTLFDYGEQFLPVNYRIIYEDNTGNVMVINGQVYVNSAIFNANPINLLDGTIELTGNGPIEILDEIPDYINVTVSVTGIADAKTRFILYKSDGTIAYDTSTLLALLPTSGWLVQGESVVMTVQKGQYAWGVSTDEVGSATNTFDLNITPALHINFSQDDLNQNSLPTLHDFMTDKTAVFDIGEVVPIPGCVAPSIPGSPALPDATRYVMWSYSFPISGSPAFTITNVVKPSWMFIHLVETPSGSGNWFVQLHGIPDATGTDVPVSFDINNACGSVTFSDTMNVSAGSGLPISWTFTEVGTAYVFRMYVNGTLVVSANDAASGTHYTQPGDTVQVMIIGPGFKQKHLKVTRDPSDVLYELTSGVSVVEHTWDTVLTNTYTVLAEGLTA